jgi:hypothetical protein
MTFVPGALRWPTLHIALGGGIVAAVVMTCYLPAFPRYPALVRSTDPWGLPN